MSRILLVDDEPDLLFLAELSLKRNGHEVIAVSTAEDALDLMDDCDLLLLDIRLPGMSGLDLLRGFIARGGRTPAVVMSAHAGFDTREDAIAAGAGHFLPKPFVVRELLDAVEEQLRAASITGG